jgi:hypothetical protein
VLVAVVPPVPVSPDCAGAESGPARGLVLTLEPDGTTVDVVMVALEMTALGQARVPGSPGVNPEGTTTSRGTAHDP